MERRPSRIYFHNLIEVARTVNHNAGTQVLLVEELREKTYTMFKEMVALFLITVVLIGFFLLNIYNLTCDLQRQ